MRLPSMNDAFDISLRSITPFIHTTPSSFTHTDGHPIHTHLCVWPLWRSTILVLVCMVYCMHVTLTLTNSYARRYEYS